MDVAKKVHPTVRIQSGPRHQIALGENTVPFLDELGIPFQTGGQATSRGERMDERRHAHPVSTLAAPTGKKIEKLDAGKPGGPPPGPREVGAARIGMSGEGEPLHLVDV